MASSKLGVLGGWGDCLILGWEDRCVEGWLCVSMGDCEDDGVEISLVGW